MAVAAGVTSSNREYARSGRTSTTVNYSPLYQVVSRIAITDLSEGRGFFMAKNSREVQARADAKRAGRTRNYATVVYPESAPADWRDVLESWHVPALVSPLHDKDVMPDGTAKKAHYHVMVMFDTPQNYETQVKPMFDSIGAVGREMVSSTRGYARYLCHLDSPDKAAYKPSDVTCLGGADYQTLISSPSDDLRVLGEIIDFLDSAKIYSFAEFITVIRASHPDWFGLVALSKGWFVREYIKSLAWEKDAGYVRGGGTSLTSLPPTIYPSPASKSAAELPVIDLETHAKMARFAEEYRDLPK